MDWALKRSTAENLTVATQPYGRIIIQFSETTENNAVSFPPRYFRSRLDRRTSRKNFDEIVNPWGNTPVQWMLVEGCKKLRCLKEGHTSTIYVMRLGREQKDEFEQGPLV